MALIVPEITVKSEIRAINQSTFDFWLNIHAVCPMGPCFPHESHIWPGRVAQQQNVGQKLPQQSFSKMYGS